MKKIALIALLLLVTGCIGNLSSVHRGLEISKGEGALIDIKQRAILTAVVPIYEDGKLTGRTETRVCAEPSPDALSAYAAELVAKADTGKIGAEVASAFQEGSSFVGLRTQSIQLLRDASYRLCESYLSGAIDAGEYGWLLRRFQRNMVVLLAVEQVTGAMRAPSVTIKMQGKAEAAKSLAEITDAKEKLDSKIATLESGTTEEKEANKDKLAQLKKDSKTMSDALENARGVMAGGTAESSIESLTRTDNTGNGQYISSVVGHIKDMVDVIIHQDDKVELCFLYLRSLKKNANETPKLQDICLSTLLRQNSMKNFSLDIPSP